MLARRSPSVSNSLAARARSSSSGGSTFSCTSRTVISTVESSVGEREGHLLRVPGRGAEQSRLELARHAAGSELDDRVALSLSLGVDEIDDERVAVPGGAAVGGCELGDRLPRPRARRPRLLRYLDLGARHLERRPVDDLGERLDLDGRREAPRLVGGIGKLELVLGLRDGRTRLREAALQNQPPM